MLPHDTRLRGGVATDQDDSTSVQHVATTLEEVVAEVVAPTVLDVSRYRYISLLTLATLAYGILHH